MVTSGGRAVGRHAPNWGSEDLRHAAIVAANCITIYPFLKNGNMDVGRSHDKEVFLLRW